MTNKTTSAIDLVERVDVAIYALRKGPDFNQWNSAIHEAREAARAAIEAQSDTITRLQAALEDMRQQGQAEGFAAAIQWLRDRSAIKPPATLWHAASLLADQMERSNQPCSSVGGE